MYYVYLIKSVIDPQKNYIGYTRDLESRLEKHNNGGSVYTSAYRPWKIVMYLSFVSESRAIEFEKYLKSGSGNAFAKKRFW